MRKRVLLDVDGVVADLVSPTVMFLDSICYRPFPSYARKLMTTKDVSTWDIAESVARYNGAEPGLLSQELQKLFNQEGFVVGLPVYPDAREMVERCAAVADVYFVTAGRDQSQYWHYERFQWLTKHFGGLFQDIIFANHKHIVEGNFFLDDKPSNVLARMELGSFGESYLMDRSWNRSCVDCAKVSALDFAQIVEASC